MSIPAASPSWPSQVIRVWQCIIMQFEDPELDVGTVLEKCNVCDRTIQGQFRRYTGRTIEGMILYHRTELTKKLLGSRELSICEISKGAGFRHKSSFFKVIRRVERQIYTNINVGVEDVWVN